MIPIMPLPWQHTSPHISSNTNKYNSLWELAHHTKRCLCTVKTVEAVCCFRRMAPVWKLFKFKLIIPLDSNTQRRLHYFCITQHAMELPQFCTFAYKSFGSAASVRPAHSAAHSSASLTQR